MPRSAQEFRARVLAHKRDRTVHLGEHVTLLFEDELTIRYQIQEMLRIEKMFEEAGIQDELDAYNPLVPDGSNLKATMLLEYEDADARRGALAQLQGHRGRRLDARRRIPGGACDRRRGPRSRERREDLGRALRALRAHAGDDRGVQGGRALWRWASTIRITARKIAALPAQRARGAAGGSSG